MEKIKMKKKINVENSMFGLSPYETFESKPDTLKKSKDTIKDILNKSKKNKGEVDSPKLTN
jgi:hypothetical protein